MMLPHNITEKTHGAFFTDEELAARHGTQPDWILKQLQKMIAESKKREMQRIEGRSRFELGCG